MSVEVKRDRKGPCYEIGHKRGGYWESIFLTEEELVELVHELDLIVLC